MALSSYRRLTLSANVNIKTFVRESDVASEKSDKVDKGVLNFSGDEARIAYEEIINRTNDNVNARCPSRRKKSVVSEKLESDARSSGNKDGSRDSRNRVVEVTTNSILRAVEIGDVEYAKRNVTSSNVNVSDDYGWTPLMSAAFCGRYGIVDYLLKIGADPSRRDRSGFGASDLASKRNHSAVVALLKEKYSKSHVSVEISDTEKKTARISRSSKFYCSVCDETFTETTRKKHEASTLHIFNEKPKLPAPAYAIPRENKGHRILLSKGWKGEGLGPDGSGSKYPIKTVLKADRRGLGHEDTQRPRTMNDQLRMLKHLQEVESKAAEILTDKQEVIDLDKRRNDDRVGMRALQKHRGDKAWITVGPILMKINAKTAEELLMEDQKECDIAVNKIRSELKVKVNELRDLEHNPPVPGLMLKPMSHGEMTALHRLTGKSL